MRRRIRGVITRARARVLIPWLLLAAATAVILVGPDLPPPRLLWQYGLPPAGGPTGRTVVVNRIEFAEISPGYVRVRRRVFLQKGDFLGSLCRPLGLPIGTPPLPDSCWRDGWVEAPRAFWIGRAVRKEEDRGSLPGHVRGTPVPFEPVEDLIYFANAFGVFSVRPRWVDHLPGSPVAPPLLLGSGWSSGDLTTYGVLEAEYQARRELAAELRRLRDSAPPRGMAPSIEFGESLGLVFNVWVPPDDSAPYIRE